MQYLGAISKTIEDHGLFPRQTNQHQSNPSLCPNRQCQRSWSWPFIWRQTWPFITNTKKKKKKDVLFTIGDWNAKVGSQEIPGVTSNFSLGIQNETGQRLTDFCQENTLVITNILSNNIRDYTTHWHHQMVNTKIRMISFFAGKNGEALYSQQKEDLEMNVTQTRSSLL